MAFKSKGTLKLDLIEISKKQMGVQAYNNLDADGKKKIDAYAEDMMGAIKAFIERQEMNITDLEMDANGYYRLQIDTTNWQTLYRFSGRVTRDSLPCRVIEFGWYSAHHWIIGDTLGYVIANNGLSDDMVYVGYDTTYLTWFNGFEVPIVNGSSY